MLFLLLGCLLGVTAAQPPLGFGVFRFPGGLNTGKLTFPNGVYFANTWTWEAWVRLPVSTTGLVYFLTDAGTIGLQAWIDAGPIFQFYRTNGGSARAVSTAVSVATWTHIAVAFELDTTYRIYVNGSAGTSGDATGSAWGPPNVMHTVCTFGSAGGFSAARFDMIQHRFWNVTRTAAQINASYTTQLVGNEAGLQIYYSGDACSGTAVPDLSPNGYNGTLSGSAVYACDTTASPTATPTANPTASPTATPTATPTASPTAAPSANPTAAPTPAPTPLANYDIFLVMGQSNAVGRNTIDSTYPANATIKALNHANNNIVDAVDPLPVPAPEGGEGVGFAITVARNWAASNLSAGRSVLIINCARGGTSFSGGTWVTGGLGTQWCLNRTTLAFSLPGTHRLVAVLWHQGESDAINGTAPATHANDLMALIAYVRSTFPGATSSTPWIAGRLPATWLGTNPVYNAIDRVVANVRYLTRFASCIANEGITGMSDSIHFNAVSQRAMGELYYSALAPTATYSQVPRARTTLGTPWAYFSFESGLNDTSGNNRHASSSNASAADISLQFQLDSTRNGTVYVFPALPPSTYLTFPGLPISFTLAYWRRYAQNAGSNNLWIVTRGSDVLNRDWVGMYEETGTFRKLCVVTGNAGCSVSNVPLSSIPPLIPGTWYFHALTYAAPVANLYLDGRRYGASAADAALAASGATFNGSNTMVIGTYEHGLTQMDDMDGRYDDVMAFTGVLSPTEISALFLQTHHAISIDYSAFTPAPSAEPTAVPTLAPSATPTAVPTPAPSAVPTVAPTPAPTPLVNTRV